jgi:hypothetical protein
MNLIGADAWRWRVRPIGDGKFLMRFPTTKMANQWSNLKNLTMKNEAQIKIEAWTPVVGEKGCCNLLDSGSVKSLLTKDP